MGISSQGALPPEGKYIVTRLHLIFALWKTKTHDNAAQGESQVTACKIADGYMKEIQKLNKEATRIAKELKSTEDQQPKDTLRDSLRANNNMIHTLRKDKEEHMRTCPDCQ